MVAKTIELPNVKKMFIPDPGFYICDSDLAQADAQVVAWEANDDILKAIFRDPDADLHNENATAIFKKLTPHTRSMAKRGVHAVNYGVSARTLAISLGITVREAEDFIYKWFSAHPGIKDWHDRTMNSLMTTRTIYNKFGFRKVFFDRIEHALPQALAWTPQSTVAIAINKGMLNVDANVPDTVMNMQVHDSVVYQTKIAGFLERRAELRKNLEIVIPYEDPLTIPIGLSVSRKNWGECIDIPWEGDTITDKSSPYFNQPIWKALAA
jgi:DNA polymerase-1